jgi:hypothetical protein
MGSPGLRKPERTIAERIRFRQDRSADIPKKSMRAYCAIQRCGRCRVRRFLLSNSDRRPRPMGAFLILRPSKRAAVRDRPLREAQSSLANLLARDRCSPNSAMRKAGKPDGSYRWLDRATRCASDKWGPGAVSRNYCLMNGLAERWTHRIAATRPSGQGVVPR